MTHPPVMRVDGEWFPVHRAVPMGFCGSVAWAQSASEVAIDRAKLPESQRLVEGRLAPGSLPIWASIIDDVWALEEEDKDLDPQAPTWMEQIGAAWDDIGVQTNATKDVFAEVCGEAQGAYIHGEEFWCGVRRDKRLGLMQGCVKLLSEVSCSLPSMERFVGKLGFCQFFKTVARSLLGATYEWITAAKRSKKKKKLFIWMAVTNELFLACLLLPYMEIDLRSPWCTRVEASDASPGGAGRAWAWLTEDQVSLACRTCDSKGVYTNLSLGESEVYDAALRAGMKQVDFNVKESAWTRVGKPGGYNHINIEEARALAWSVRERLVRPGELGHRVLHAVDSTAVAGSVRKGRSSSRQLNRVLRKIFGLALGGNLELFVAWIATSENPADAPSSWYGIRSQKGRAELPPWERVQMQADQVATPPMPAPRYAALPSDEELIQAGALVMLGRAVGRPPSTRDRWVLVCGQGVRRQHDLMQEMMNSLDACGYHGRLLSIDPEMDPCLDLLYGPMFDWIMGLVTGRQVDSVIVIPPCATFSRARHVPLGEGRGPRRLRRGDDPRVWLPGLTDKEQRMCARANVTLVRMCWLLIAADSAGAVCALSAPADLGGEQPSVFHTEPVKSLTELAQSDLIHLDQCMFGSSFRKPTSLWVNRRGLTSRMARRCAHRNGHRPALGMWRGGFEVESRRRLEPALSRALASALAPALKGRSHGARDQRDGGHWRPSWARRALSPAGLEGEVVEALSRRLAELPRRTRQPRIPMAQGERAREGYLPRRIRGGASRHGQEAAGVCSTSGSAAQDHAPPEVPHRAGDDAGLEKSTPGAPSASVPRRSGQRSGSAGVGNRPARSGSGDSARLLWLAADL